MLAQPDERLNSLDSDERELIETYDKLIPETQKDVRDYTKEKLELQNLRAESRDQEKKTNPIHDKGRA
jgi:hypothetical protein